VREITEASSVCGELEKKEEAALAAGGEAEGERGDAYEHILIYVHSRVRTHIHCIVVSYVGVRRYVQNVALFSLLLLQHYRYKPRKFAKFTDPFYLWTCTVILSQEGSKSSRNRKKKKEFLSLNPFKIV